MFPTHLEKIKVKNKNRGSHKHDQRTVPQVLDDKTCSDSVPHSLHKTGLKQNYKRINKIFSRSWKTTRPAWSAVWRHHRPPTPVFPGATTGHPWRWITTGYSSGDGARWVGRSCAWFLRLKFLCSSFIQHRALTPLGWAIILQLFFVLLVLGTVPTQYTCHAL